MREAAPPAPPPPPASPRQPRAAGRELPARRRRGRYGSGAGAEGPHGRVAGAAGGSHRSGHQLHPLPGEHSAAIGAAPGAGLRGAAASAPLLPSVPAGASAVPLGKGRGIGLQSRASCPGCSLLSPGEAAPLGPRVPDPPLSRSRRGAGSSARPAGSKSQRPLLLLQGAARSLCSERAASAICQVCGLSGVSLEWNQVDKVLMHWGARSVRVRWLWLAGVQTMR